MRKKIILASLVVLGSIELSAYTYEVNPLIGKNFTESNALTNDSTAYGIRLNKYISEDNAIMFGYTRINAADYKKSKSANKNGRTTSSCDATPCQPAPIDKCGTWDHCNSGGDTTDNANTDGDNASDGSNGSDGNTDTGNDGSTGSDGSTNNSNDSTNGGTTTDDTVIPTPGNNIGNLSNSRASDTDINRFYINGLHNIKTKYSRLVPYVYGGFGYEHVENELADNDSQGFFNAGGGLKFRVNDRFNLVSDIQCIKKFRSHDLDILGSIGVGYLFGSLLQPEPESLVASGLEDIQPASPKREITIVKVAPQTMVVAPVLADKPKGEYYVQMAAGFKTDMETGCKHTRDLRQAGIDYDIKYTTIKGRNAALVVVGPFETKEEARSQLPSLRRYSKDAFVKKIKD